MEAAARYAIGAVIGAVIGALVMWQVGERRLTQWIAAAEIQQANERARIAKLNEDTIDGYSAAITDLWRRLLAGERPRPAGLPPARVSQPPGRADGRAADAVDAAARAASALGQRLAECERDYTAAFDQAAMTTLQLIHLQHWLTRATDGPR